MNQIDHEIRTKSIQDSIDKEVQSSQAYAFNVQNSESVKKMGRPDHVVHACSLVNFISHEDPNGDPDYKDLVNTKCQSTATFDAPPGYESARWNVCGRHLSSAVGDWNRPIEMLDSILSRKLMKDHHKKQCEKLGKNFLHMSELDGILKEYRISRAQFLGA